MSTSDERISLNELQHQLTLHVAQQIVLPVNSEDMQAFRELLGGKPGTVAVRAENVCGECWLNTRDIMISTWPCLVRKLLVRDQELTRLVRLAEPASNGARRVLVAELATRLGLDLTDA